LGSACSPTSDSPPPSGRPGAGSRRGRCVGRVAERTSISAQSAGDATAAACPASRSSRSPGGPLCPTGTRGRPACGDRHRSGAAAGSQAGAAGAGFPRSGRQSPPAHGARASQSARPARSAAPRGRSRGRAYIIGRSDRRRPSGGTLRASSAAVEDETAFERHYSVEELTELWRMSDDFVRRLFLHEPGVIIFYREQPGKRVYRTLRIPALSRPTSAPPTQESVTGDLAKGSFLGRNTGHETSTVNSRQDVKRI